MRRLRLASLLVLAVAAALAAGCGGDDETTTETVTVQETTGAETTTEAGTTTAEDFEVRTGLTMFVTPSGNIGCSITGDGARCDISERDWEPTPKPPSCDVDYGQGIGVSAEGASFVCAGDTVLGGTDTLSYGQAAIAGSYRCESATEGVTCSNTETGAGFFISRGSYRIF